MPPRAKTRLPAGALRSGLRGFTLVELILVMLVMATIMALVAPTLSRSMRERHLDQEAIRLLALTELSRSAAISTGVPMVFWIDAEHGRYGTGPKSGFAADQDATREFAFGDDVRFDGITQASGFRSGDTTIEFAPDGVAEEASIDSIRLADRFGAGMTIARTADGYGYEILKEAR